jgi:hypothetical protein
MKKIIIILLFLLLILTSILFFYFQKSEYPDKGNGNASNSESLNHSVNQEENISQPTGNDTSAGGEGAGGGGSAGGGGGGGTGGDDSQEAQKLPDDLYSRECSFYFSSYGICAGTCPSGTCTQDGRSCYCKNA